MFVGTETEILPGGRHSETMALAATTRQWLASFRPRNSSKSKYQKVSVVSNSRRSQWPYLAYLMRLGKSLRERNLLIVFDRFSYSRRPFSIDIFMRSHYQQFFSRPESTFLFEVILIITVYHLDNKNNE